MKPLFLLIMLLPALAGAEQPSEAGLEKLKDRIEALSEQQQQETSRRDDLQARLRDTETRVGELTRQGRELEREAEAARQRLVRLEAQQARLAGEKRTQLRWLARTVRASYQSGREARIKLLLNQQEPDRIARLLRYQEYIQRARTDRLAVLEDELLDLRRVAKEVEGARADLLDRRTDLASSKRELEAAAKEREQALASLNRSLDARGGDIERLKADQQRLEKLLADMQRSLPSVPPPGRGEPFGKLAGELPCPVPGQVVASFHSAREGALRWEGVVLAADEGTPIRAIHPGRVVFADWMRGYGLLTIVDHGGGYLTLYGYAQSLLRDVGEWVATGDTLALAGRSGGNSRSGLYFEIRRKGQVVNPARWCDRRVTLPPIARND
ncbi:peptidoglycan DD-metalloendopeptidase family protein [Alcanivorax marinus]|nr:peptidoglycan DD-metalloendopeptidase family protein [Alloalcanivorax marinus]